MSSRWRASCLGALLLVAGCLVTPAERAAKDDACPAGLRTFYEDADGDGYGDAAVEACALPTGAAELGGDCDDLDPARYPGAPELCDGVAQSCDALEPPDERGLASFESADGRWTALPELQGGQAGAPVSWTFEEPGTLWLCGAGEAGAFKLHILASGLQASVRGVDTQGEVVLSGGGGGPVIQATDAALSVEDLILRDGVAERGGGVDIEGGTLLLRDVRIEDCSANSGGGLHLLELSSATLREVTLSGNTATGSHGGGLRVDDSAVEAIGLRLLGNTSSLGGGGVQVRGESSFSATDLLMQGNTAGTTGGGAFFSDGSTGALSATRWGEGFLDDCLLSDNLASNGAALWSGEGTQVQLSGCGLSSNATVDSEGDGAGGAISVSGGGVLVLSDSWMQDNHAIGNGGALRLLQGTACMDRVAVVDNQAEGEGGGVYLGSNTNLLRITAGRFSGNAPEDLHVDGDSLGPLGDDYADTFDHGGAPCP